MRTLKTPLRYPGGKSRAINKISPHIPKDITEYREPFLGGGSVALYVTQNYDVPVWVNDLYEPLYNFWKYLQSDGERLSTELADLKTRYHNPDRARVLFGECKECLANTKKSHAAETGLYRAISFWVVNKCSFSGLTESSSFSPQASENNFTMRGIEKLPEYSSLIQKWTITNVSYEELINDGFVYLDPPYDIKDNLYGKKGSMHRKFDHDRFAADCAASSANLLVSYNSNQLVRDRFDGWTAIEFDHTYTMRSTGDYTKDQKDRKELLLKNY